MDTTHTLSKHKVDAVIAELVIDAPSDNVKTGLKIYQYNKSIKQMESEFSKFKVPELKEILAYLNYFNPSSQYLKPELINYIICRIQNLLPEKCGQCSEIYRVKNNDLQLLSCKKCGQEMHKKCLLEMLSIGDNEELDSSLVQRKINPFNVEGLHYLCKICEDAFISIKHSRKNKERTHTESTSEDTSLPQRDIEQNKNRDTVFEEKVPRKKTAKTDKKAICHFLQLGTCKHGITGRNCSFEHPKLCQKLLNHGTNKMAA